MNSKTKKISKRALTLLLAIIMSFSLIIPSTFAVGDEYYDDNDEIIAVDEDETVNKENDEDTITINGENFIVEEDMSSETEKSSAEVSDIETFSKFEDTDIQAYATTDNAYVYAAEIEELLDGQAPFDKDNEPGDDMNDSNFIIRSFDYINYTLSYVTALNDTSVTVDEGTLCVKFVLPVSPTVAIFNMDTMNWMDNPVLLYTMKDGTVSDSYDDAEDVVSQTLTGSRHLTNAESMMIPGAGTLSVGLYVGAASNGDTITPTFTLWIDGNSENEEYEIVSDTIIVSAAPKYALQVKRNSSVNRLGDYDLITGTSDASKDTISGETTIHGRMEAFGVTFMLKNDSAEKGLKGLYFPSGTVTFDINLSEILTATGGEQITGEDVGWTPILWDYIENGKQARNNSSNQVGTWGRILYDYNYANSAAPANKLGQQSFNVIYNSCYDGGSWSIVQDVNDPQVYHVTIQDYTIDYENYVFPTRDMNASAVPTTHGTTYKANEACISAGYIQCIMQFPETTDLTQNTNVYMNVLADNFAINGDYYDVTAEYGNSYQLVVAGSFTGGIWFGERSNSSQSGSTTVGSDILGTGYTAGDAFSYSGNQIRLNHRVNYTGDETGSVEFGFTKWDADAFEVTGHTNITSASNNKSNGNDEFYYVGRESNWADDTEMSNTLINDSSLRFFDSPEAVKNEGLVCVGGVWIIHGTIAGYGSSYSQDGWYLTVKDDVIAGNVYQAVGEEWMSYNDVYLFTQIGSSSEYTVDENALLNYSYYVAYCSSEAYATMNKSNSTDRSYIKSVYDGNGNVTAGTNVTAYYAGTSLLICGEEAQINITIGDTVDGKTKTVYDLDAGERTVNIVLTPSIEIQGTSIGSKGETSMTDLTITVTLPYDLSYDLGSAYYGDEEISPTSLVYNETTGETTIVFTVSGVTIGEDVEQITFDCTIGHAGAADDVVNNQNISLSAVISSTEDNRTKDAKFGNYSDTSITVVRLAAIGISKVVDNQLIELNGDFAWTFYMSNSANTDINDTRLADILPKDGDELGSSFTGDYKITGVTIDFSNGVKSMEQSIDNMGFYVTTEYPTESVAELVEDTSIVKSWTDIFNTAVIDGTTVTLTTDGYENIRAFYFDLGTLMANEYVNFTLYVETEKNEPGDVYFNIFDEDGSEQPAAVTSVQVATYVVSREISGLTWYDENKDGIRNESENLLSDIKASLYRTTPSEYADNDSVFMTINGVDLYSAYSTRGNAVDSIVTGTDGTYDFVDLEAGTYYVVFDDINKYVLTETNVGNDDTVDSDAYPIINGETLAYAYIPDILLPELDTMGGYFYESSHNDAGFYSVNSKFIINKIDDFGNTITGAEFTLTDSQGNLILFDVEGDVYTVSNTGTTSVINAGYVTIDGLALGTYTLAEIKAPDSYEGMSGMIEVTVDKDGSVTYEEIVSMPFFETIANAFESAWNSVKTFVVNLFDSEVAEVATEDYSIETTVINVINHELTSVAVNKMWVDNNDCDGIRPTEINVDLFADGTKVDSATITATDNWEYTFTDLPKYNDGQEIAYTVSETAVDNYTDSVSSSTSNGFVITNTHEPERIDVSGLKTWIDNNNQDGVRPDEITVILYADGIETNRMTVAAADDWSYTFNNLAKYRDGGIEIVYTVAEIPVDDYTTTINGTNITNTYSPETTNISGVKTWIDNDDQDGIRPDSITVNLYADGVKVDSQIVTAADNWTYSFDNLDRYRDGGIEIVYTVTEEGIDGYTSVTNGTNFTNTHMPYVVDIPVQKMWNDDDDRDGIRPDSIDVVLTGSDGNVYNATLSDDNDWSYTFKDLPVNYNNGTEIVYELNEVTVDGYLTSITEVDGGYSFLIENTHIPETMEVPVEKIWVDNDNEYDYRPDEIQVILTGTVNDEIVYQETAILSEDTDWEYLFKDLFTYMDGTEVTYTISESSVDNYYADITGDMIDGYTITNTAVTPKLDKELLDGDTWDTWDEADNDQEITFRLTLTDIKSAVNLTVHDYIDGEFNFEADTVESILYDGENETVLENGTDYVVIESECTDPDCIMAGCTFEVSFNDDVFADVSPDAYIIITYKALTDTHADNYVGFVDQIYNEAYILFGATDSMHRSEIVSTETDLFGFDIYKYTDENGELVGLGNAEFVLSRNDVYAQFTTETDSNGNICYILTGWADSIENADIIVSETDGIARVDGLNNGTYALTETTAPVGYYELEDSIVFTIDEAGTVIGDTVITGSEYTVVGVENEKILTSVTGTKTWNDNDNYDGIRPDEITIRLYADGEEVDSMTVTAEDDWTYMFNDLAAYNDGVEIEYTIAEDEVDGYATEYNGYDVVNTHESETTSIGVTKVWNDEDNADGIRPDSVTIVLAANGEPTDYTIELTVDNDWTGVFENLDIYADGNAIEYGLYELDVDGYTSEVTGNIEDGFIVTNTHETTAVVSEPKNDNPTVINNTSPTVVNNGTEPVTVDGQTTTGQEADGTNTTNTDSAKTGDNIIEIIAIMFVSLSAIGVIAYTGLKKRKEI